MPVTTRGFQTPILLTIHFRKHGREFGCTNEVDYELKAMSFFARTNHTIRAATRPRENDSIFYDFKSNEFGVLTAAGFIRTYFKPQTSKHLLPRNLDYYLTESVQIKI